jgi:hypothetical protein
MSRRPHPVEKRRGGGVRSGGWAAQKKAPGDARGPRLHLQCEDEAVEKPCILAVERGGWGCRSGGAGFVAPRPGPRRGS